MRLLELELINFCQYEHRVMEFHPGVTGLVGGNGAGKSNALEAAIASLTNGFSFGGRTKPQQIRNGLANVTSSVRAKWQVGSNTIEILRGLSPDVHRLRIDDGREITGDRKIAAELRSLLGVPDVQRLAEELVVRQWQMFAFILDDPSRRIDDLARLCGLGRAEELVKLLGEAITADRGELIPVEDRQQTVQAEIDALEVRVANQKIISQMAASLVLTEERERQIPVEIAREQRRVAASRELLSLAEQQQRLQTLLDSSKEQSRSLSEEEDGLKVEIDRVRLLLATRQSREALRERIRADQEILARPLPEGPGPDPGDSETLDGLMASKAGLESRIATLRPAAAQQVGVCPTCHQPLPTDPVAKQKCVESLQEAERELGEIRQYIVDEQQRRQAYQKWCERHRLWDQTCRRLEADQHAARQRLEQAPAAATDEVEDEAVTTEGLRELEARGKRLRRSLETVSADTQSLNQQLGATTARLQAARADAQAEPVDVDVLTASLTRSSEARRSMAAANQSIQDASGLIMSRRAELATMRKKLAANDKLQSWIDFQQQMRDIVHRDALPAMAINYTLREIATRMNRWLDKFGQSYIVEPDVELASFWVVKTDGRRERARGLSGGQMVVLAAARHLAVNEFLFGSHGFLALDEPTVGLEDASIDGLCDVLASLSQSARSSGRQIIIITHDKRLARIFDRVIEV
jgi:DNA repair exonuclease SbcCD ATPase subunit